MEDDGNTRNDKYIKCSRRKCRYINDDEHIKYEFGYNRLSERFKTCAKCRKRTHKYCKEHREQIRQQKQQKTIKDILLGY